MWVYFDPKKKVENQIAKSFQILYVWIEMGLFKKIVCKLLLDQKHHVTIHKGQNPPPTKGVAKRMNYSLVDKAK
jgi:hypothetical protein